MCKNVPLYSQYLDVKDGSWRNRACGIIALKTAAEYWSPKGIAADKLIEAGLEINAYLPEIGWRHKPLAKLADKAYSLKGKNFDLANLPSAAAWRRLNYYLNQQPVIASVYKNFKPGQSGHLIVLTKSDGNKVYYHEPMSRQRKKICRQTPLGKFLVGWKKRFIVIRP